MEAKKDLVTYEARDGQSISLSFDTIKKYLVQGHPEFVTAQEMIYFMGICKSRGLNPFAKDCYLIKYSQKDGAAIITSIDYFRKRAKAQKDCKGWSRGIIVERNGEIVYSNGLMLESDILLGAWFEAQPEGWEKPFKHEVNLSGYIKRKSDGSITKFWSKENQPSQIGKVAESQGLRTLWPDEFQQLYTPEEMDEADMFKSAEVAAKSQTEDLNEKLKSDAPPGKKENLYETKDPEVEKKEEKEEEKEDPIRALYKNLGKPGFTKFLESHRIAIPAMPQKYQDEIKEKHQRLFPGESYPLDQTKTESGEQDESPNESLPKTETEKILTLVQGARLTESGIAIEGCPNNPKGISALRAKCDGIGLVPCQTRVGCPNWTEYDKAK